MFNNILSRINFSYIRLGIPYLLIVLGAINSTIGNVTGGIACFSAGFLILILTTYNIAHLKFGILEAKMEAKLNEAQEVIDKLRSISLPVSEIAIVSASQMRSRGNPLSRKELFDYVETICSELKKIDANEENIKSVKKPWAVSTAIEMSDAILRKVDIVFSEKKKPVYECASKDKHYTLNVNGEEVNGWEYFHYLQGEQFKLMEEVNLIGGDYLNFHKKIIDSLNSSHALNAEDKKRIFHDIEEELQDLEFFLNHNELKRPEVWFAGNSHLFGG